MPDFWCAICGARVTKAGNRCAYCAAKEIARTRKPRGPSPQPPRRTWPKGRFTVDVRWAKE